MASWSRAVFRLCSGGVVLASIACGGRQETVEVNPCDEDAKFSAVNVCLVPASDERRRGVPVTADCYWMNKAIGDKRLWGLNAPGSPVTYDVYVYNFCTSAADVELRFPDEDVVCGNADASGAIPIGTVAPDGKPRRGTCQALAYAYDEFAARREGRYTLFARIGSATGTYDPEVVLERGGEPPIIPGGKPPAPPGR